MKKKYETVVIFDGSLPDETVAKEQTDIEEFLKKEADYEKTDAWGKKALAYPIKKKKTGFYTFFVYDGESDAPAKMDKLFKLNQNVIRHMTVLYEEKPEIAPELLRRKVDDDSEKGDRRNG